MPRPTTNLYISDTDMRGKYLYLQRNKGEPKYMAYYKTPFYTKGKMFYSREEGQQWLDTISDMSYMKDFIIFEPEQML